MKLIVLIILFRFATWLTGAAQSLHNAAKRFHQWSWRACERENLKTCSPKQ